MVTLSSINRSSMPWLRSLFPGSAEVQSRPPLRPLELSLLPIILQSSSTQTSQPPAHPPEQLCPSALLSVRPSIQELNQQTGHRPKAFTLWSPTQPITSTQASCVRSPALSPSSNQAVCLMFSARLYNVCVNLGSNDSHSW